MDKDNTAICTRGGYRRWVFWVTLRFYAPLSTGGLKFLHTKCMQNCLKGRTTQCLHPYWYLTYNLIIYSCGCSIHIGHWSCGILFVQETKANSSKTSIIVAVTHYLQTVTHSYVSLSLNVVKFNLFLTKINHQDKALK